MKYQLYNINYSNIKNTAIDESIKGLASLIQEYMLSADFLFRRPKTYYEDRHHFSIAPMNLDVSFEVRDTITNDTVSGFARVIK